MAVDATPYPEGKGWAIRLRYKGNDTYLSGRKSAAQARADAQKEVTHIDKHGQPAWGGPKGKTVAQALQRQAAQTLRFKKGTARCSPGFAHLAEPARRRAGSVRPCRGRHAGTARRVPPSLGHSPRDSLRRTPLAQASQRRARCRGSRRSRRPPARAGPHRLRAGPDARPETSAPGVRGAGLRRVERAYAGGSGWETWRRVSVGCSAQARCCQQ